MRSNQKTVESWWTSRLMRPAAVAAVLLCAAAIACDGAHAPATGGDAQAAAAAPAPPASQTGGFDGSRAWSYLEKIQDFGPRPPASANIHREQRYLVSELQSFGCKVSEDNFQAQTKIGELKMENIVAKIPGRKPGIILLLSHYDTLRLPGFVGANDGGSSTALLLEVAHDLCGRPGPLSVWIAFLDGEEDQTNVTTAYQAQNTWSDNNALFGSRELAAQMDLSSDLKKVKAVMLADMIGDANPKIAKDSNSTPWLVDLVWGVAKRLGYSRYFVQESMAVDDDHMPFIRKGVSAVDVIGNVGPVRSDAPFGIYWHTTEDTLKHCSPHTLAVVGHVFLASIQALDEKFAPGTHAAK